MRKLLVCLLILSLPSLAGAVEWSTPFTDSVNVVETLRIQYDQTDEDNPFWVAVNRLNLLAISGPFIAGMRYDAEGYFLDEEYYVRYIPEKVFFQYENSPLLLRLGDSYVRFGQGLTLSLLKRDEFGEDTTVQGGLMRLTTDYAEFEALLGPVNPGDDRTFVPARAQVDEPSFYDERDFLRGMRFLAGYPGIFQVGGTAVSAVLRFDEESELAEFESDDQAELYSVVIEAPDVAGAGAIDGEYAWLDYTDGRRGTDDVEYEGRGAHLAMTWYLGPSTLLLEATDYYRFDFLYNDPPSMEYPKLSFGHLPNYADAIGVRGRLDYLLPGLGTNFYFNYTNIQTHREDPAELADHYSDDIPWLEWIEHSFGGFDHPFSFGAMLSGAGGYREIVEGRWVHGELDFETPLVHPHSLSLGYHAKQFHGFGVMRETEYASHEGTLSYGWTPYFSLTGMYEHSDEPISGTVSLGETEADDPHFWSVETVLKPTDSVQLSLAYGRYKGGLKCAGGVCRQIPPFEGFKSELVFTF